MRPGMDIKTRTAPTTIHPDSYIRGNDKQRQYNLLVLDLLQSSFGDGPEKGQFIDLGCGTGDFTREHLLPRCPNVERLVAVDVSEDMVDYARKNFAHPKICHDFLDIASVSCVTDFVRRNGQFDRVYSFFCLNWIKDQETAFKNVAELLKPGGECLIVFDASSSAARMKKKLTTLDRWQKYRKMLENTLPPSVDLQDQDDLRLYISGILKNASLIPTTCEVLQVTHAYAGVEDLTSSHMRLSYLSTVVTEEEKPLLLEDVAAYAAKLWAEKEAGGSPFRSSVFLVHAHKPRH